MWMVLCVCVRARVCLPTCLLDCLFTHLRVVRGICAWDFRCCGSSCGWLEFFLFNFLPRKIRHKCGDGAAHIEEVLEGKEGSRVQRQVGMHCLSIRSDPRILEYSHTSQSYSSHPSITHHDAQPPPIPIPLYPPPWQHHPSVLYCTVIPS